MSGPSAEHAASGGKGSPGQPYDPPDGAWLRVPAALVAVDHSNATLSNGSPHAQPSPSHGPHGAARMQPTWQPVPGTAAPLEATTAPWAPHHSPTTIDPPSTSAPRNAAAAPHLPAERISTFAYGTGCAAAAAAAATAPHGPTAAAAGSHGPPPVADKLHKSKSVPNMAAMAADPAAAHQHHHHHHHHHNLSHHIVHNLEKANRVHQALFEDRVFDEKMWEQHRDCWHRHRMEPLVFMKVALGFAGQIFIVVLISIAVGLYYEFLVPLGAPAGTTGMATAFNLMTFALSLLLVFKTNSSFARWWEARVIWGQIVNFARNYTRLVLQWTPPEHHHLCLVAVHWTCAAPYVLRGHIKQMGADSYKEASHLLSPVELDYLSQWKNPPGGVARVLSWVVSELVTVAHLSPQQQQVLEDQITIYVNMAGGCERIYKTPIPVAYARHTSRFLMIFCSTAPILLWNSTGWTTPVIVAIVAFLLLGTENIGVQIEEPFHVLPLHAYCKGIEANVKEMEEQSRASRARVSLFGEAAKAAVRQRVSMSRSARGNGTDRSVKSRTLEQQPSIPAF